MHILQQLAGDLAALKQTAAELQQPAVDVAALVAALEADSRFFTRLARC